MEIILGKKDKDLSQGWVMAAEDDAAEDVDNVGKPLNKGKEKATEDQPNLAEDQPNLAEEEEMASDSDEDLDADIRYELDELYRRKRTPEINSRIINLRKLLNGEIQKAPPKVPVPDFWGHGWYKTPEEKSKKNKFTPDDSTENNGESSSSTQSNENPTKKPKLTSETAKENMSEGSSSNESSEKTVEKTKQTPTEYVHELESIEPMSHPWDDGD
jgi:hypothetical protein